MVKRVLGALTTLVFAAWLSMVVGPMAFASSTPAKGESSTHSYNAQNGSYTQPQPYSNADLNGTGANPGSQSNPNPYKSTRDGSASGNGNGNGAANGKPCAGCVGRADNKNPAGQQPGPQDHNNGYECDGNHGIARGNPAHTACTSGSSGGGGCAPDVTNNDCSSSSTSTRTASSGPTAGTSTLTSLGSTGLASAVSSAWKAPLLDTAPLAGATRAASVAAGTRLAFTGSDSAELALVGLVLLSGGLLVVGAVRRRASTR